MSSTHTLTHTFYIKTPCPATRIEITLTLESTKNPKGSCVEGKPTECSHNGFCHHRLNPKCYLNAIHIKGRKRQREKRRRV